MRKSMILCCALLMLGACGRRGAAPAVQTEPTASSAEQVEQRKVVVPEPPAMMTDRGEQALWLTEHYWDNFDFTDTTYADAKQVMEVAFGSYATVLSAVPVEAGIRSVETLFDKAQASRKMYDCFTELAELYFYDPNSPVRNDEYYIVTLQSMVASPLLDEYEKIRPQEQLKLSLKNRVGTPAADFRYTLASGETGTLYGIKAPFVLIFINNPGCPACKEVKEAITASGFLSQLIQLGVLKVLAIYPDQDLTEWYDYAPNIPEEWINSYDKELRIKDQELYDLQAIPTLYLLDGKKQVLLKDCMSIPRIEQTIYDNREKANEWVK